LRCAKEQMPENSTNRRTKTRRPFRRRATKVGAHGGSAEDDDDDDSVAIGVPGIPGFHCYVITLAILLVCGLSFVHFLALPTETSSTLLQNVMKHGLRAATGAPIPIPQLTYSNVWSTQSPQGMLPLHSILPGSAPVAALRARADQAAKANPSVLSSKMSASGGIAGLEGDGWLQLSRTVGSIDNEDVTFGAWVFLSEVSADMFPSQSASMKTIVATKLSGCTNTGSNAAGWALFCMNGAPRTGSFAYRGQMANPPVMKCSRGPPSSPTTLGCLLALVCRQHKTEHGFLLAIRLSLTPKPVLATMLRDHQPSHWHKRMWLRATWHLGDRTVCTSVRTGPPQVIVRTPRCTPSLGLWRMFVCFMRLRKMPKQVVMP